MNPEKKSSQEIASELRELKDIAFSLLERIKRLEQSNAVPSSVVIPEEKQESPAVAIPAESSVEKAQSFESKVGRIWFNRIGMVAIIFGAAYFMKYAFDNNWIGVTGRVILGLCAGLILILTGELWHKKKFEKFSEGLIAGGASIIYLSILAAFNYYHLIGAGPAFAFMSIVTLYIGVFSIRFNSPGALSFGVAGGFLTLFLIGSSESNSGYRMMYVFLLDAGVLAVSYFKKYIKCNIVALILTIIWYYSWFFTQYRHAYLTQTISFLTAIYILFSLLSILYNFVHKQLSAKTDVYSVMFNGLFYFFGICNVLQSEAVPYRVLGFVSLALAVVYLLFSYTALMRTKNQDRHLILSYLGLTLLFTTLTIPLVLEGNLISLGFIAEAAVLVWLGFKINYKELRYTALVLCSVVIMKMFFFDFSLYESSCLIFNRRFLTYLALVAGTLISAYNYRENSGKLLTGERRMATTLVLLAAVILLADFTMEIDSYFATLVNVRHKIAQPPFVELPSWSFLNNLKQFSISALWGGYSFILILIGIFRKFRSLRLMAIVLLMLTILKVFMLDIWAIGQLWRILSFIALGLVLVVTSFFYQKYKDELVNFVKG